MKRETSTESPAWETQPDSVLDHLEELQRAESERRRSEAVILGAIATTQSQIEALRERLLDEVLMARQADIPWAKIGDIFSISETAAYRRFDPEGRRKHAQYQRDRRQEVSTVEAPVSPGT